MRMTDAMISRMELDKSFVPPFPERPQTRPTLREALARARVSLLDLFTERDFFSRQMRTRLMGRDFFVSNNPGGLREAFGEGATAFDRKTRYQRKALGPVVGDALIVSDGPAAEARRAIIAPLLQGGCPAQGARIARAVAIETCARWHAAGSGTRLDMLGEMGTVATGLAARLLFGDTLGRRHGASIARDVALFQRDLAAIDLPSLAGLPAILGGKGSPAARLASERLKARVDAILAEIAAHDGIGAGEGGLCERLLAPREDGGAPLRREAVRNEALGLFVTARETTAATLAWALYLVSKSPRVATHLAEELDRVLEGRPPEMEDLANLTYTRAVVEETLRLYPPIPLLARVASGPGHVNGMAARRGALLVVAPWLVQRNRTIWSLPDHFVPERFDAAHNPVRDPYSFLPFSVGPRGCPAQDLAMTELVVVLATLLQTFRIDHAAGHRVSVDARLLVRPGTNLPMDPHWRPAASSVDPAAPPRHDLAALDAEIAATHAEARAAATGKARGPRPAELPAESALAAAIARLDPAQDSSAVAKAFRRAAAGGRAREILAPRLTREETTERDAAIASGRPILVVTVASAPADLFAAAMAEDFGEALRILDDGPAPEPGSERATTRAALGLPILADRPDTLDALAVRARMPGSVLALHLDAPHEGTVPFPPFARPFPETGQAAFAIAAAREAGALILPVTLAPGGRKGTVLRYHAALDAGTLDRATLEGALVALYDPFVRAHLAHWRRLSDLALAA